VSELLFTAFSNRSDAIKLAHDVGSGWPAIGFVSSLHLLDSSETPKLDASTLVVSLGGDGTFLRPLDLAHAVGARGSQSTSGQLGFLLKRAVNRNRLRTSKVL